MPVARSPRWILAGAAATVLLAVVTVAARPSGALPDDSQTPNRGCTNAQANEIACSLATGSRTYRLDSARSQYLKLTNTTSRPLQIDTIQGAGAGRGRAFLEYCIGRNRFETGQSAPGEGEAACTSRNSGTALSAIRPGGRGGLTVAPGDTLYVSFSPMQSEPYFTVRVTASRASGRQSAWRQPRVDQVIRCNGESQQTRWAPWVNQGPNPVTLRGAVIYSQGAETPPDRVDAACLYVLNTQGEVRYRHCDGVNTRNPAGLDIPPQTVAPGEAVAGQATNVCPAPAVWGWAAYMLISN
jgi:hypothetical protein